MELRYSFDPERYFLGKPCEQGCRWPGTDQSLRRIVYRGKRGGVCGPCMGCKGRQQSSWLLSFIDYEASGFPPNRKLGKLCSAGHRWHGLEASLRYNRDGEGHCVECERIRKAVQRTDTDKCRGYQQSYLERLGPEEVKRRQRERWLNMPPDQRQARVDHKRRIRKSLRSQGLTTRGTVPVVPDLEDRKLRAAIRRAGRLPSVVRLVQDAQRLYWRENPEARRERDAQRARDYHRQRWQADPGYRLYHHQKSRRRKALERGSIGLQVKPSQIRARFEQFGNCCAYCGSTENLQIEHLVPIARGGTHVLGNILPACRRCNYSKKARDAETWYRAQPWFSETRWRRIRQVLGIGRGHSAQLALL
jgi:5-methylcytosine-specific restriction endonuclease McrA